ncbi:apolipoprotein N-acyltransferase [Roseivirga sp. BDSF3-8]|uniref:apolipoprotein N-acyltransferase n=1 Tax=Roseivirga sp. BDSF3-8 TaxID=3241598 RepID=UPI0035319272
MKRNNKTNLYPLFGVPAGLLLFVAWPPQYIWPLLFIAFIPYFFATDQIIEKRRFRTLGFFLLTYTTLLTWNLFTNAWIYNTKFLTGFLVSALNPLLFAIPLLLVWYVRRRLGKRWFYFAFVCTWLAVETFHSEWIMAFPYHALGYGLTPAPYLIQFYTITGVGGGTLWILAVNVLIYELVNSVFISRPSFDNIRKGSIAFTAFAVPCILSAITYITYTEKGYEVKVVAIQTDVDCYEEKYVTSPEILVDRYWSLTEEALKKGAPDYILWPETAISNGGYVQGLKNNPLYANIAQRLESYPGAQLITGAILYEREDQLPPFASQNPDYARELGDMRYYTYNAALQIGKNGVIGYRSKEKLVPFEEQTPYPQYTKAIKQIVPSLGGFAFSTSHVNNTVFRNGPRAGSALICFESAFGELASKQVRTGANILFVMLNEGWYKHSGGASQIQACAVARAIENRRTVVRSSNNGISSIINQRGDVIQQADMAGGPATLTISTRGNDHLTPYTHHSNLIGKAAQLCFLAMIALCIVVYSLSLIGRKRLILE